MPSQRVYYNDDGLTRFLAYPGSLRPEMLTDVVDVLIGTPVTSLVQCVSYGDVALFSSDVASMYGWREGKELEPTAENTRLHEIFQQVRERVVDIPYKTRQRALEKGFDFIPSMRMNDVQCARNTPPEASPLAGEFRLRHPELMVNPGAAWPGDSLDFALDYTHKEVREFRLDHANEIIDRYAHDGFEMDWTRHYRYFPPGKEQPDLITQMLRTVRRRMDLHESRLGRKLPLIVRVAPGLKENLRLGLDVRTWVKENLISVIVPSSGGPWMTFDMPVPEWMELVAGTPVEVHPAPEPAVPEGYATLEMYRAVAANYRAMGADGVYFNDLSRRGFPFPDDTYLILRDTAGDPDALSRRNKRFCATAENWRNDTDTLPVELRSVGQTATVGIMVGDEPGKARARGTLSRTRLRIRLDSCISMEGLDVTLNGRPVDLTSAAVSTGKSREISWGGNILGPWCVMETTLNDTFPRHGNNIVTVQATGENAAGCFVTDVDLVMEYEFCGGVA